MTTSIQTLFDEEYYERGIPSGRSCYVNYRWIPELTIPMAVRIIEHAGIKQGQRILDFGCAKGYLVKALRLLGYDAYGVDISEYALASAPEDVREYLYGDVPQDLLQLCGTFDWIIAKDVLEHIPYEALGNILSELCVVGQNMWAAIPLGFSGTYRVPAYELDQTHVIREPLEWWIRMMEKLHWQVDSAVYHVPGIKENWSQWPQGNGFIKAS